MKRRSSRFSRPSSAIPLLILGRDPGPLPRIDLRLIHPVARVSVLMPSRWPTVRSTHARVPCLRTQLEDQVHCPFPQLSWMRLPRYHEPCRTGAGGDPVTELGVHRRQQPLNSGHLPGTVPGQGARSCPQVLPHGRVPGGLVRRRNGSCWTTRGRGSAAPAMGKSSRRGTGAFPMTRLTILACPRGRRAGGAPTGRCGQHCAGPQYDGRHRGQCGSRRLARRPDCGRVTGLIRAANVPGRNARSDELGAVLSAMRRAAH